MAHLPGRQVVDVSPLLHPESRGPASSPHGQVQPGLTQDPRLVMALWPGTQLQGHNLPEQ